MERYVPFVENQQTDFLLYLKECRPKLNVQNSKANTGDATKSKNTDWFFLNNKGEQVSSSFLLRRLRYLKTAAGIEKDIGLHGLRHSIATHLLSSGMPLESISRFLGHKNIESTQRYTHVETPEEIYQIPISNGRL